MFANALLSHDVFGGEFHGEPSIILGGNAAPMDVHIDITGGICEIYQAEFSTLGGALFNRALQEIYGGDIDSQVEQETNWGDVSNWFTGSSGDSPVNLAVDSSGDPLGDLSGGSSGDSPVNLAVDSTVDLAVDSSVTSVDNPVEPGWFNMNSFNDTNTVMEN